MNVDKIYKRITIGKDDNIEPLIFAVYTCKIQEDTFIPYMRNSLSRNNVSIFIVAMDMITVIIFIIWVEFLNLWQKEYA